MDPPSRQTEIPRAGTRGGYLLLLQLTVIRVFFFVSLLIQTELVIVLYCRIYTKITDIVRNE